MKEKLTHKILDDLLKILKDYTNDKPLSIISIKLTWSLSDRDKKIAIDKLQKDGYIEKKDNAIDDYFINFNGLMFIETEVI